MNWQELDGATRAGFIAAVVAVGGLIVPPLSMASALVAMVCSGIGWRRSRKRDETNPVATSVFLASAALIVLVVVGSAIYSAGSP